jgi:protein HIRA/HIR1
VYEKKPEPGAEQQQLLTVIACAGQDKCLTIWDTNTSRPLLIIQDFALKSIVDLSWSPDADVLVAVSLDGSILTLCFEDGDIGYVAPLSENERLLNKYGANRRAAGIIEGPEGVILEERSKIGERKDVEDRMGELMGHETVEAQPAVPALVNGNGETKPVVPPISTVSTPKTNGVDHPMTNGNSPKTATSETAATQATTIPTAASTTQTTPLQTTDPQAAKLERMKQRVTITADGKRRIQPLLVSASSAAAQSLLPRSQLLASTATGKKSDAPTSIVDLSKPFDGLPPGGLASLTLGNKRKLAALEDSADARAERRAAAASRNGAIVILNSTGVGTTVADQAPAPLVSTPEYIRPAVVNPSLTVSQVRLAVPKLRTVVTGAVDARTGEIELINGQSGATDKTDSEKTIFEARNATNGARPQDRDPTRIIVTRKSQTIWQDFLQKGVLLITGNQNFWCAACEDGSLHIWSPAGRRMLNAIILDSQPVILESRGWWLLCLTAAGLAYVWDLQTVSSPHPPVSLAPILDLASQALLDHPVPAPSITSAHINSTGKIVVTLSNGGGYMYAPNMFSWQRVSEPWWAVASQYWNTTDYSVANVRQSGSAKVKTGDDLKLANISAGIIPQLERTTTQEAILRGRAPFLQRMKKLLLSKEGFEGLESCVSVAHLENRIAAAMQLGAKDEFRVYLYTYAKRIGAETLRLKVQELLRLLLGSLQEDTEDSPTKMTDNTLFGNGWSLRGDICGWDRKELLKDVVLILGKESNFEFILNFDANLSDYRQTPRYPAHYASLCTIR